MRPLLSLPKWGVRVLIAENVIVNDENEVVNGPTTDFADFSQAAVCASCNGSAVLAACNGNDGPDAWSQRI